MSARALQIAAVVLLLVGGNPATARQDEPARRAMPPGCADDVPLRAERLQVDYASGSRTIRGLMYRPTGPANGAGVVLLHGARGLQADAPTLDPHAIQLASRGYHVLAPNYYDAEPPRERRTGRDVRRWEAAASDGVRFLGSRPGVHAGRVAVWGYSLGGFLAVDGAIDAEATARAAVAVSAGTDVFEPSRGRREAPVLMIHGEADPVISAASMRTLAASLRRRGADVEVQMLDTDQHGMTGLWCDVFGRSRRFLDTHLLTAGP